VEREEREGRGEKIGREKEKKEREKRKTLSQGYFSFSSIFKGGFHSICKV
jgi:regulator of replication initiation timing